MTNVFVQIKSTLVNLILVVLICVRSKTVQLSAMVSPQTVACSSHHRSVMFEQTSLVVSVLLLFSLLFWPVVFCTHVTVYVFTSNFVVLLINWSASAVHLTLFVEPMWIQSCNVCVLLAYQLCLFIVFASWPASRSIEFMPKPHLFSDTVCSRSTLIKT